MLARFFYTTLLLLIAFSNLVQAQICQGSLGDPIVNITFGAGPNPGAPLSAATTNYTYSDNYCPKDGFYSVTNLTTNCHDSTWFTVKDHTGDANGYFMLVNASFEPGQFYLDTVRGLCSGSTYEFASWLINVKRPVPCWGQPQIINPNITFRIEKTDGTVLQSFSTGDLVATDPPQWKQYGFYFTTPSGVTDVVLRMVNNAPGGCGNDIGLDDITFRPCGPQITTSIEGTARIEDTICQGTTKSYLLKAQVSPGYNNPAFQWQSKAAGQDWTDIAGANSQNLSVTMDAARAAGVYSYRVVVAEYGNLGSVKCRVSSQEIRFVVVPPPVAVFSFDAKDASCANSKITFKDSSYTSSGTITRWNWDAGDGSAVTTYSTNQVYEHTYNSPGDYTVKLVIQSSAGCVSQTSRPLTISPSPSIDFVTGPVCENNYTLFNPITSFGEGVQVSYTWDFGDPESGSANSSTLKNPSHMYTSIKPYTVTLTASTGTGCKATVIKQIATVNPQPVAAFTMDKNIICQGETISFTEGSNGAGSEVTAWFWNFGDGYTSSLKNPPAHGYIKAGTITPSLYVMNSLGCKSNTAADTLTVYALPRVDAGLDKHVKKGESVEMNPKVSGKVKSYLWSPATYLNADDVEKPIVTPESDILYRLTVTSTEGCVASDELMVRILQNIVVPNAFSPNNDGINDKWEIPHLKEYPLNKIRVYNRQGAIVYESYNYAMPWDGTVNGKPIPVGVYYYVVEPGQGYKPITGSLTVLR